MSEKTEWQEKADYWGKMPEDAESGESETDTVLDATMAKVEVDLARVVYSEAELRARIESLEVENTRLNRDRLRAIRAHQSCKRLLGSVRERKARLQKQLGGNR